MKKIKCDWFGTSIHSTQTGRDTATRDKDTLTFYFNPLYPNGQRQQQKIAKMTPKQLQSTLPKRVETNTIVKIPVSIYDFNPLYPNGQRPPTFKFCLANCLLQSTLPKRVETTITSRQAITGTYFNPLYPNGQRRLTASYHQDNHYFNPLYPNGQRHYFFIRFHRNEQLQSTLPKRVETSLHGSRLSAICNFNPLYPNGQRRVSIKRGACRLNFNPLYPNGQRHTKNTTLHTKISTSIHSTQTGRDQSSPFSQSGWIYFNPLYPNGQRLEYACILLHI